MTFEEMLDQAGALLKRQGRVVYRALKRQFNLDDAAFEDLKEALLYAHAHVVDGGRGLVWTGEPRPTSTAGSPSAVDQARAPLSSTPPYLAEGFIQVQALGPVPVNGLAAPVEVYELVGATAIRWRLQAAAVLGEAGMGKSRLVYEFVQSHRLQEWLVLESASVSYGHATPYLPVIDLLKRYAHVEEGDDACTMRAKVTGQVLTSDDALQETIPALLALLEALPADRPFPQLGPPQRRQRTLDALKRVLVRESQAQPLLAARIDRLPAEEKHLLQTAAVIGHDVPWRLLQAIAERPEDALHRGLAHLQTAEFLYETRLFPELEYTFKHALTHEVAYGSLLQERRRALHARIVEALEALFPDGLVDQADRLAHHALRGEVWDKAGAYGRQAGIRVAARSAHREAVAYFEQVLAALAQLPERRDTLEQAIDVRFDLHSVLMQLNEHGRILDQLRGAEPLAERLGDDQRLGRIAFYLSVYFSAMGEYDRALAASQRALALATSSGAFDVQVAAQTFLGQVYYTGGEFRQGLDVARQAVASRDYLMRCLIELGGFAEGRGVADEARQIAEVGGQPFSIAASLFASGLLARRQGDVHQAIPVLERSLALDERHDIPRLFPMIASVLGAAYALAGRPAEARAELSTAIELYRAMEMTLCRRSASKRIVSSGSYSRHWP